MMNTENVDSNSLGTTLIQMLAQQIGGILTIKDDNGVKSSLKFNASHYVMRAPENEHIN